MAVVVPVVVRPIKHCVAVVVAALAGPALVVALPGPSPSPRNFA